MKMKQSILTILTVFLILSSVSCNDAPNTKDCAQRNPFSIELAKSHRDMFLPQQSAYEQGTCGGEWKTFGTCCKLGNLTDYAIRDGQKIRRSIDIAITNGKSIAQIYMKLANLGKNVVQMTSGSSKKLIEYVHSSEGESMIMLMKNILEKPDFLKSQTEKCWNKMIKVRSSSLCFTCSGRSESFFDGEKALISQESCNSILNECSEHFNSIFTFFVSAERSLNLLINVVRDNRLLPLENFDPVIKMVEKLTQTVQEIVQNKVQQSIRSYIGSSSNLASAESQDLCSKLVRLSNETTFIELIAQRSQEVSLELNSLVPIFIKSITANVAKTVVKTVLSNFKIGLSKLKRKRALQIGNDNPTALSFNNSMLVGDVKVMAHVDSSYTSYQGALGTDPSVVKKLAAQQAPMDIQVQFP